MQVANGTGSQVSPNIVMVVLDDVGFGQIGCYGSSIETPAIDALAATGLRYSSFHTTGVCSSTRATLLTGRNQHAVGIGTVIDMCDGRAPGYTGTLSHDAPTLADRLRDQGGYATFAVGKWHLCSRDEQRPEGPFTTWPLARGFDRFYGFLGGATSQWTPNLTEDNHPRRPPATPDEGYHLSEDLVDQTIRMIRRQQTRLEPAPFFAYLSFGCGHEPHHVAHEWADHYRGRFDDGWDIERERVFARQQEMGMLPGHARLPEANPGVPEWASLSADERRVFVRMQEVFAGFLTHCDAQIGRLVEWLRVENLLDDTMIVVLSDNGASPEGGTAGFSGAKGGYRVAWLMTNDMFDDPPDRVVSSTRFDEYGNHLHLPERVDEILPHLDRLGLPGRDNHYPQGWAQAGNTPFRRYKQNVHYGGTRDPLIVSWPNGIDDRGAIRTGFCHSVDLMPTCLRVAGLEAPPELDGHDLTPTFAGDAGPDRTQYFEVFGHRGIQRGRWKAVAFHPRHTSFDDDVWELYDTEADPTETTDLAEDEPELLAELVEVWFAEAERNQVLPLQDIPVLDIRFGRGTVGYFDYDQLDQVSGTNRPDLATGPVHIRIDLVHHDGADGVLFADGAPGAAQTLEVADGTVRYGSTTGRGAQELVADRPLGDGTHRIELRIPEEGDANVELAIDGEVVGEGPGVDREAAPSGRLVIGSDPDGLTAGAPDYPGLLTLFIAKTRAATLVADSEQVGAAALREQ